MYMYVHCTHTVLIKTNAAFLGKLCDVELFNEQIVKVYAVCSVNFFSELEAYPKFLFASAPITL